MYFHPVKDEMFYFTWLRVASIFHLVKIYVTSHSLAFIIYMIPDEL